MLLTARICIVLIFLILALYPQQSVFACVTTGPNVDQRTATSTCDATCRPNSFSQTWTYDYADGSPSCSQTEYFSNSTCTTPGNAPGICTGRLGGCLGNAECNETTDNSFCAQGNQTGAGGSCDSTNSCLGNCTINSLDRSKNACQIINCGDYCTSSYTCAVKYATGSTNVGLPANNVCQTTNASSSGYCKAPTPTPAATPTPTPDPSCTGVNYCDSGSTNCGAWSDATNSCGTRTCWHYLRGGSTNCQQLALCGSQFTDSTSNPCPTPTPAAGGGGGGGAGSCILTNQYYSGTASSCSLTETSVTCTCGSSVTWDLTYVSGCNKDTGGQGSLYTDGGNHTCIDPTPTPEPPPPTPTPTPTRGPFLKIFGGDVHSNK